LLVAAAGSVIGVPLLIVAALRLSFSLVEPSPLPVPSEELPDLFPLLGFWRDARGQGHCRAFLHGEISENAGQLPEIAFGISSADLPVCSQSFEAYNATGRWPDSFAWAEGISGQDQFARFEAKQIDSVTVEMYVAYGRGDGPNDSWYEVRDGSQAIVNPRYQRYFGPALAVLPFFVSVLVGIGLYVVLATVWVFRGPLVPMRRETPARSKLL
jgi:hypothetical protein